MSILDGDARRMQIIRTHLPKEPSLFVLFRVLLFVLLSGLLLH